MTVRPPSTPRQASSRLRNRDTWHAIATVYIVVGKRGRQRTVIVVRNCPFRCPSGLHVHSGKPDFIEGKRTAPCGGGRYLVQTGTVEGEVAA